MAASTVSFLASSSSTPITINIHPKLASSAIHASISQNYPLASKIIVKNLPFSASESRLVKEFSQYGQIAEVKLVKDEAKQKSKGFAFIQYTSQEAALIALESMDRQLFDDRRVFVELANLRRSDFGGYPKTSGPPQEQQKVTKDDVDE
ncbi:RNA-binding family protein [Perilla frutescens var. hirtella]|nr:RNA-binding family protein [Perilla frutescens var. hirtella]